MTRPLTTTSYAILGLLVVRDWTTYELAKQVRRSLNWFWPRAERKLYEEPKRLVAAGYVTGTREQTGQRARTVYRVTEDGRAALRDWLGEPSEPRSGEFEAMVKVFFADGGSREQLLVTLDRIADEATERLETLAGYAAGDFPFPRRRHLSALTLRLQHDQEQAVLAWARWARAQVEDWTASDDPGDWDVDAALAAMATGPRATSR